jgi:hypothetical protein
MLTFELIGKSAGIVLYSDYLSLRQIHRIVHDGNERSTIIRDKEGFFVGFAYDLRKAYEGTRRKLEKSDTELESCPRFGVEILWPTVLVQSRQLRDSLAFMDHSKEHQAVAWELEFMIEEAIESEFKDKAPQIKEQWQRLSANHPFMEENASTRVAQFAAWSEKDRRNGLEGLLTSLDPMYPRMYPFWVKSRKQDASYLIAPADFEVWKGREFPNPEL